MGMVSEVDRTGMAASLEEVKAYLRITGTEEDEGLSALLRGAEALCEQFVGQWLIVRTALETVAVGSDGGWRRLTARPVLAIEAVETVDGADGSGDGTPLPVDAYAIDIDANGDGWVRIARPVAATLVRVRYRAGLASGMDGLPEALRQGIVRLAADHYLARGRDSATPPAVVSALWRPWRRMRLA